MGAVVVLSRFGWEIRALLTGKIRSGDPMMKRVPRAFPRTLPRSRFEAPRGLGRVVRPLARIRASLPRARARRARLRRPGFDQPHASARQQQEQNVTPQFRSGQTVRLSRGILSKWATGGEYKVVRQLPDDGGEQQYCIKSVREPHERVVRESDLEKI
jgi:hypothetical protein